MKLILNDEEVILSESANLAQALIKWGFTQTHFAVAINSTVISRSEYEKYILNENDRITVIVPMQGG